MAHKTRPRMLCPSAFDNEKVSKLNDRQYRLWTWMFATADDDGRGQWWTTRAATAPNMLAPCKSSEAERDGQAICDLKLASIYSVNGNRYYQMHDWKDHQHVRADRYIPSTYPCQPNGNQVTTNCQPSGNQTVPSSTNTSSSTSTNPNTNHDLARGASGGDELPLNIQKSKEIHLKEYHQWVEKLRGETGDRGLVDYFIAAMNEGIEETYLAVGGKFTDHRKGRLATRMAKFRCDSAMFAIEVFCDRHRGTKDERYICGIARQKDRLTEKELDAEIDRHRAHMGDRGLFKEVKDAKV